LRYENQKANIVAQQASGHDVGGYNFHIQEQLMHENLSFSRVGTDQLAKPIALVGSADSLSATAQSAKPTALVG
jgi:hypothetical protein